MIAAHIRVLEMKSLLRLLSILKVLLFFGSRLRGKLADGHFPLFLNDYILVSMKRNVKENVGQCPNFPNQDISAIE